MFVCSRDKLCLVSVTVDTSDTAEILTGGLLRGDTAVTVTVIMVAVVIVVIAVTAVIGS